MIVRLLLTGFSVFINTFVKGLDVVLIDTGIVSFFEQLVSYVKPVIDMISYFLPMKVIASVLYIHLSYYICKFSIVIFRLVKSLIPTMGGV